jgi:hypothetical protein
MAIFVEDAHLRLPLLLPADLRGIKASTSAASFRTFGLELLISLPARDAFAGAGCRGLGATFGYSLFRENGT